MELNFNEVNNILKTLPIGLYAKRRVPCSLDTEAEASYYSPIDDTIVVSFPMIADSVKTVEETPEFTRESVIRTMLYHEVSHAILTPRCATPAHFYQLKDEEIMGVFNIFEDERIETLLHAYYFDVDFKKQVYYINGGKVTEPKTAMQAFYNLVRFRVDFHGLLPNVDNIISRYPASKVNGASTTWEGTIDNYIREVRNLYEEVKSYFYSDKSSKSGEGEDDESETSSSTSSVKYSPVTSDEELMEKSGLAAKVASDAMKELKESETAIAPLKAFSALDPTKYRNEEVYKTLEAIISQFNKKNNTGNNGISSYSGILSPRNFLRDDFRYFDKKIGINGNNKFGTLHLNLMLDDSGSYRSNDDATNEIIQALINLEKTNSNFTFDVYFVAEDYRKAKTNSEKYIHSNSGNILTDELFDLVRNAQKPNSYNYNIVMFDGNACSMDVSNRTRLSHKSGFENFAAFNRDNVTIISDTTNQRYMEKYCPSANKIYIDSGYPQKIGEVVAQTLTRAFR